MSLIVNILASLAIGTASLAGGWVGHVLNQEPMLPEEGIVYLHGSPTWRPAENEEVTVESHLFVVSSGSPKGERIAKIYAANVGVSVNRPEDKDVLPATPTVIGFVPVSGQAELKISLLGKPYFVHASKMQVVRSTPVSREEIEWLHAQEALSPKRVAEF